MGKQLFHVYTYNHHFGGYTYTVKFADMTNITLLDFLRQWINYYFNRSNIEDIDKHIEFVYLNVSLVDLEDYIRVIEILKNHGLLYKNNFSHELLLLQKSFPNLSFEYFFEEYLIFHGRRKGLFVDIFIEEFKEHIKTKSNKRIGDLWWIWKDFSGDYVNYIEWLPRETLDDLIMIQNSGEYQPDYTTYIQ